MARKVKARFRQPQYRRTFLRAWREHRQKTLEQAADFVDMTHASLSRIERGLQPYNQDILEGLADYYSTDVASLLMRNPTDPEGIWSIWEQAKPGERRQLVEIGKTLIRTGT